MRIQLLNCIGIFPQFCYLAGERCHRRLYLENAFFLLLLLFVQYQLKLCCTSPYSPMGACAVSRISDLKSKIDEWFSSHQINSSQHCSHTYRKKELKWMQGKSLDRFKLAQDFICFSASFFPIDSQIELPMRTDLTLSRMPKPLKRRQVLSRGY